MEKISLGSPTATTALPVSWEPLKLGSSTWPEGEGLAPGSDDKAFSWFANWPGRGSRCSSLTDQSPSSKNMETNPWRRSHCGAEKLLESGLIRPSQGPLGERLIWIKNPKVLTEPREETPGGTHPSHYKRCIKTLCQIALWLLAIWYTSCKRLIFPTRWHQACPRDGVLVWGSLTWHNMWVELTEATSLQKRQDLSSGSAISHFFPLSQDQHIPDWGCPLSLCARMKM